MEKKNTSLYRSEISNCKMLERNENDGDSTNNNRIIRICHIEVKKKHVKLYTLIWELSPLKNPVC